MDNDWPDTIWIYYWGKGENRELTARIFGNRPEESVAYRRETPLTATAPALLAAAKAALEQIRFDNEGLAFAYTHEHDAPLETWPTFMPQAWHQLRAAIAQAEGGES